MSNETLDIEALVESGDIECCAACQEYSAYSWTYVTPKEHHVRLGYDKGDIAHIGACSGFEWECGHCGAHNVPEDSPLLDEVYTHVSREDREAARELA
jgi:hypothetical protein